MIISTRESAECRARLLKLGVSQISGGSKTSVGGYFNPAPEDENSAQFDVSDRRPLDDVIRWLMDRVLPSFAPHVIDRGVLVIDLWRFVKVSKFIIFASQMLL